MVLDPARKPRAAFPAELLGGDDPWVPAAAAAGPDADSPRAPPWVPAAAARHEAPRREALAPLAEHPGSDRRVSWSPGAADVESENEDDVAWSDDAASDDDDDTEDDVTRACLDLLRGGQNIAPIDKQGRFARQHNRGAGRAAKAGQEFQPLIAGRHIFALILIFARHNETV